MRHRDSTDSSEQISQATCDPGTQVTLSRFAWWKPGEASHTAASWRRRVRSCPRASPLCPFCGRCGGTSSTTSKDNRAQKLGAAAWSGPALDSSRAACVALVALTYPRAHDSASPPVCASPFSSRRKPWAGWLLSRRRRSNRDGALYGRSLPDVSPFRRARDFADAAAAYPDLSPTTIRIIPSGKPWCPGTCISGPQSKERSACLKVSLSEA